MDMDEWEINIKDAEELQKESKEKTTEIRPHKWSSWGIEIYSREREGKTEHAYIIDEQKWAWIGIEGNYELVPVEQHKLLAPLFADTDDTTSMCFVIDGHSIDNGADGGNIEIQFLEQHLKTEYATLYKKVDQEEHDLVSEGDINRSILSEMGFKDHEDGFRHVIQFNQRKLGE